MHKILKQILFVGLGLIFSITSSFADGTRILKFGKHLDFGTVAIGNSATRELTLYNNGDSELTISNLTFHKKIRDSFSGNWSGIIPAHGEQNVTITFTPIRNTRVSGLVYVESDRTNSGDRSRSLKGLGEDESSKNTRILRLGKHLDFGDVAIGSSSLKQLTVYNDGNSVLNISKIRFHQKLNDVYTAPWTGSIPAYGSKLINITFKPIDKKNYNGLVYIESDKTNNVDRSRLLRGVGIENSENQTPTIHLNGESMVTIVKGSSYVDAGAVANDVEDGNITANTTVAGIVNTDLLGEYNLTYTIVDSGGLQAEVLRTVNVVLGHIDGAFNDPDVNTEHNVHAVGLDMSEGTLRLVLDGASGDTTFPFIWVANSGEGTISLLSTETGVELGRYRTGPTAWGNPSRTTVDQDGNVWVGNRNGNTITKVGLNAWNQCIDRNGNGVIDTSTGGTDVKAWTGSFGDGLGFSNAEDECILQHVTLAKDGLSANAVRLVAVDADNNLFAGGSSSTALFKVNGATGAIISAVSTLQNHYGGVIDKHGNIWSMPPTHNGTVQKISADMSSKENIQIGHNGYGITIDKYGKVWTTELRGSRFSTFDPSNPVGTLQVFNQIGHSGAQGIASDANGDIFIAGNLWSSSVGQYRQTFDGDGNFTGVEFVKNHAVQSGPTGVAVDATGKVWASNYYSNSVSRINPITEAVEHFSVGSHPYNYSDMTGNVVRNITEKTGTWEATFDSEENDYSWNQAKWRLKEALPAETTIKVFAKVANAEIALAAQPYVEIQSGVALSLSGRYLKIKVELVSENLTDTPEVVEIELY